VNGQPPAGTAPRRLALRLRGMSGTAKIVSVAAALLVAAIAVVSVAGNGTGAAPRTLPTAKNFTLSELGHPGRNVSLAAFAGRPVIVNFFASWCPPCKRETPLLARFYRASGERTAMIGVDSGDQNGPALRFVRAAGVRYPVGFDPLPAAATISYGVLGLPQTFFLNDRHQIVKRVVGQVTMKTLSEGVVLMDKGWRSATPAASKNPG
jgi:thiol-disulfide isomerase/thioredoxin